jgi:hypothetical protein
MGDGGGGGGRGPALQRILSPRVTPSTMADRSKLIRKCSVMTLKAGKEEEYRASHNEVRARHKYVRPPRSRVEPLSRSVRAKAD